MLQGGELGQYKRTLNGRHPHLKLPRKWHFDVIKVRDVEMYLLGLNPFGKKTGKWI